MERFELPQTVLETGMLPLHHTRVFLVEMTGLEPATPASQMRYSKPTELHLENYPTLRFQVSRYIGFFPFNKPGGLTL